MSSLVTAAIVEISCAKTDQQTDRQTDRQTLLPLKPLPRDYRGRC